MIPGLAVVSLNRTCAVWLAQPREPLMPSTLNFYLAGGWPCAVLESAEGRRVLGRGGRLPGPALGFWCCSTTLAFRQQFYPGVSTAQMLENIRCSESFF